MCPEGTEPAAPSEPKYCMNCGAELMPGSNFCTACGRPQRPGAVPPQPALPFAPAPAHRMNSISELVMGFGVYGVSALAILMALNLAIVVWGIDLVWPHMDKHISLFIITPFIVSIAQLSGPAFMGYYIFLVAAIAACFAWMIYKSIGPLTDELRIRYPKGGHSPLYTMGTVLFAVLTFNVAYYFIVRALGATTSTPSFSTQELWQLIYGYAQASVWEEIVSRILLIGIPLLLIDGLLKQRNPEHRTQKLWRYILGGGFTIGRKEAVLMVFSSAMFGAAHVFSWDLYKILPAAIGGLAFAYLFLKLGLYASVMMHFATDFMTIPINVWPDSAGVSSIVGLLVLAWLALGVPYLVLYFSKGMGWLLGRRIWPDLPPQEPKPVYAYYSTYVGPAPAGHPAYPTPQYAPAPYAAPEPKVEDPHAFVCQNCGSREAVYSDGSLVCKRCGTKR